MNELLRALSVRLANLFCRGVVRQVDDSKKMQFVQVEVGEDEVREVERVQQYGFTAVPQEGAEAAILFVGGRRGHGLVLAVDDRRYRLTGLAAGEVAVYHQDGASVVLKADGSIVLTPKPGAVVELAGNLDAVALASKVAVELGVLNSAISAAPVVPGDGGAAFKASLVAALAAWPASVASGKVKAG